MRTLQNLKRTCRLLREALCSYLCLWVSGCVSDGVVFWEIFFCAIHSKIDLINVLLIHKLETTY